MRKGYFVLHTYIVIVSVCVYVYIYTYTAIIHMGLIRTPSLGKRPSAQRTLRAPAAILRRSMPILSPPQSLTIIMIHDIYLNSDGHEE